MLGTANIRQTTPPRLDAKNKIFRLQRRFRPRAEPQKKWGRQVEYISRGSGTEGRVQNFDKTEEDENVLEGDNVPWRGRQVAPPKTLLIRGGEL